MWDYMERRARSCAEYILSTGATVRACANHFGISKSTVHKDVAERLKDSDAELYAAVRKVLDKNLSERHIRGGIATRNKYRRKKSCRADAACCECACAEDSCNCCTGGSRPDCANHCRDCGNDSI